jgi:hypothetical protein
LVGSSPRIGGGRHVRVVGQVALALRSGRAGGEEKAQENEQGHNGYGQAAEVATTFLAGLP